MTYPLKNQAAQDFDKKFWFEGLVSIAQGDPKAIIHHLEQEPQYLKEQDLRGASVLHLMVWHGQSEVVKYVLERGVDSQLKNNNGETAFFTAAWLGRVNMLQMIEQKNAIGDKTQVNASGESCLHAAARSGSVLAVNELIALGFDLEARDLQHQTPLYHAVKSNVLEPIICLVEAGANLKHRNHNGATVLDIVEADYALYGFDEDDLAILNYLKMATHIQTEKEELQKTIEAARVQVPAEITDDLSKNHGQKKDLSHETKIKTPAEKASQVSESKRKKTMSL